MWAGKWMSPERMNPGVYPHHVQINLQIWSFMINLWLVQSQSVNQSISQYLGIWQCKKGRTVYCAYYIRWFNGNDTTRRKRKREKIGVVLDCVWRMKKMMTTMIDSFQLIQTQGEGGRVTDINNSINILLCGSEPRTSKSQLFVRHVNKSSPRGREVQVYTFEKGSKDFRPLYQTLICITCNFDGGTGDCLWVIRWRTKKYATAGSSVVTHQ